MHVNLVADGWRRLGVLLSVTTAALVIGIVETACELMALCMVTSMVMDIIFTAS